ncbi:hypothetical protein JL722_10523 [Aureococcus anophagefferens]|nr:hypothetical protein JL722_10523 [Aureococcus anophagefferens]
MAISYAEFHWRSAPLSHGPTVTLAALWYVLLALLAKRACDQRTPPKHTSASYVLAAHSAVLAVASLVMCAGALREAFARSALEGSWSWFFCENRRAAPKLYFWAYAYYLSKYYELLDTFLPVLVHGRVPRHFGMHVFHHACVLFMSWGYLDISRRLDRAAGVDGTAAPRARRLPRRRVPRRADLARAERPLPVVEEVVNALSSRGLDAGGFDEARR